MERCGLLGETLGHSYSPAIHAQLGDYEYRLYECPREKLGDFLKTGDFDGLNVTIPYKKAVIPCCAELSSMAAAIGEKLGLTGEEIARGVASYAPTGSRMRVLRLPGERTVLDDCYNANPQSVTAALEILAKTDCAQRVAVLGDMGELGDLTAQAHYNMGALAVMLGIDLVIAIGTHAAKIAEGVECSGGEVRHFATKEEALPTIRAQLTPQTAMLIKASHAMRFGWLVEALEQNYD